MTREEFIDIVYDLQRGEFADRLIDAFDEYNNDKWIPVSEGLPSKEDTYLVAWVEQHHVCPYPHYYGLAHWHEDKQEWGALTWLSCACIAKDIDILAWMPLPDFYWEGVKHE